VAPGADRGGTPRPVTETIPDAGRLSRAAAHRLLGAVLDRRQSLDEALAADAGLKTLPPRDRAFARLLAATVLRRLGLIDAALARYLEHPLPERAGGARHALRLGAAQLLFLGTPAHAAVDGAVALVDDPAYRGLVNAVMRRLSRDGIAVLAGEDLAKLATPDWLWQGWVAAYGETTARAIVEAHWREPPLDLSVKADAAQWAARLGAEGLGATLLPNGSLRLTGGGAVAEIFGFEAGAWWVQDAAAAMPAKLFGEVKGKRIADLCAAPGGKTAQLAAADATVTALDRSPARLAILKENLARLDLAAITLAADAAEWRTKAKFDGVLLDAPCTGTGTIRRHPDILHLKSPADAGKLAALQDRLLDRAWRLLAPGGVLVYCTCSLEPVEGEARIARLLDSGAPLQRLPIAASEIGAPEAAITAAGDARTLPSMWPELGGLDGFYMCRLRRA
jgi:16S rRNA (cytosine967-C5)-methyltransferase